MCSLLSSEKFQESVCPVQHCFVFTSNPWWGVRVVVLRVCLELIQRIQEKRLQRWKNSVGHFKPALRAGNWLETLAEYWWLTEERKEEDNFKTIGISEHIKNKPLFFPCKLGAQRWPFRTTLYLQRNKVLYFYTRLKQIWDWKPTKLKGNIWLF